MAFNDSDDSRFDMLRQKAEALIKQAGSASDDLPRGMLDLIQELRVNQVELDIQNEELQAAQRELSELNRTYVELYYENAPCGYVSLDPYGLITRLNRTAFRLLGAGNDNRRMIGSPFTRFLSPKGEQAYLSLRIHNRETDAVQHGELQLKRKGKQPCWVRTDLVTDRDDSGRVSGHRLTMVDVSERKHADDALRESETRYHRLFEDDLTGNFVCTTSGEILLCNQAFTSIFGFASNEEAVGTNMSALYTDPTERESILDVLKRHGKLEKYETWRKRRNGDPIFIVENLVGRFNEKGELHEIQGYIFDDTERKRAEEALKRNEERLRTLMEASSEVLYRMSPDWREMRQLHSHGFLLENAEMPRRTWLEAYIPPEDQPRVTAAIEEAIRHKRIFEVEHKVIRADGKVGWFFSRAVPLLDENGEIVEWFGSASDVTDRKQSEQALRDSEQLYRTIGETIPYGVWITDADGSCNYVSQSFLDMTGMSLEQVRQLGWMHLLPTEDVEPTRDHWLRCVRTGEAFEREHRFKSIDGSYRDVLAIGRPIRDKAGNIVSWAGINLDITERKKTEVALEALNDSLERQVAERTVELKSRAQKLQSLAIQLSEAEELERQRIAQLLHDDLQQHLVAVKMKFYAMEPHFSGRRESDAIIGECVDLLGKAVEKTRKLSHDLSPATLHFSGLPAGFDMLAAQFKADYGLDVKVSRTGNPEPESPAIKTFLFQAVKELLFNIVKHSGAKTADVHALEKQDRIEVKVADDGSGCDLEQVYARRGVEPGFGLFSIEERIHAFGGEMTIESVPGDGWNTTLTLPKNELRGGDRKDPQERPPASSISI